MKKTIMIAGAAGEGINTVQYYVEKLLKHQGYWVISYKNYMSRVRGGFNYSIITVSDQKTAAVEASADLFVALNGEAVENVANHLKPNGILLALDLDRSDEKNEVEARWVDSQHLKETCKGKNSFGMFSVGWILKMFGLEEELLSEIESKKWSESVTKENKKAVTLGYASGHVQATTSTQDQNRIMLSGNQAIALGALSAGLGFYAAYPMAPSTGIMTFMATYEKCTNIIVEQMEDEIAAAMAAIGASSNGVRAMTGTSGGGFALMVEALGFAAVAEVPLVMCNVQRPGPATGLPTRTEQADLSFVVNASQGEFARIVLAPRTVEDAFRLTFKAFNLADKYQVPVIILSDQLLADTVETVERFDLSELSIDPYINWEPVNDYERYDFNQIQGNRKYPGVDDSTLIMTDSHVHDTYGAVTESEIHTVALKDKFLKKIEQIKTEMEPPRFYGHQAYETLFVSWGSTEGALKEAVDRLNSMGEKTAMISFSDVYPLREDVLDAYMKPGIQLVNVEGNAMNQFGKLLRIETGIRYNFSINRYDGRPFTWNWIVEAYGGLKNE